MHTTCTAILVAAGTSNRMGFDKLAALHLGKPILTHSFDIFNQHPDITHIIVVCPPERFALLDPTTFTKPVQRVDGGTARHLSVANALAAVSPATDLIAVHDAARPFLSPTDLTRTLAAANQHRAATLARRVTETLKRSDENDLILAPVSRENLWLIETPQIFHTPLLQQAYQHILRENLAVTDETSALQAISQPVKLIESSSPNPKITTPADLP